MDDRLNQLLAMVSNKRKPQGFNPDYLADENIDPSLRVDAGAGAMEGELRDRIFQAERTRPAPPRSGLGPVANATNPNEVEALKNLLGGISTERANSPIAKQQVEYDAQRLGNLEAQNEGFTTNNMGQNPMQAREIYRRKQERDKMEMPLRTQAVTEAGLDRRQDKQIEGNLEHARIQMAPANAQAENMGRYYDALANGMIDPNTIKSVNRNGVTFQTPQRTQQALNPNQAKSNLLRARGALGSADPFSTWDDASSEQQYFNQAAVSMGDAFGVDPETSSGVVQVLRDPEMGKMTLSELKANAMLQPDFDEAEWQKVARLIYELRGF